MTTSCLFKRLFILSPRRLFEAFRDVNTEITSELNRESITCSVVSADLKATEEISFSQ